MSGAKRGGLTLKGGKIGRCNILRQQLLMPGERVNVNISGTVRLESLRERDVMRINAHLGVFMTPLRWAWSGFPQWVKDGPTGASAVPTMTAQDFSRYGVGSYDSVVANTSMPQFFRDVPVSIYNNWYKWPEDSDIADIPADGPIAVPLAKAWSRCRYTATPDDTADYEIDVSGATMDVRDLAEKQATFKSAMKRDVLSYNRWMELVQETWRGDGSREVDQVPIMLDQVDVGVNPREMPAMNHEGFGQWQSLYDFNVNHSINGITAPEHCVITYILTVRFPSITDSIMPLSQNPDWQSLVADPEYLSAASPEQVTLGDVQPGNSSTSIGYLPAGWKWRTDHDVIGNNVQSANSFPYMIAPSNQFVCKDATQIKDAFRSDRFGDYIVDIYFKEDSRQPIGDSMDSYLAGMADETKNVGRSNDEFPYGGKQL